MNLIHEYATRNLPHLGLHVFRRWSSDMPFAKSWTIWRKCWVSRKTSSLRLAIPSSVLTMPSPRTMMRSYGSSSDVRFSRRILCSILIIRQSWTGACRGEIWYRTSLWTVTADHLTMGENSSMDPSIGLLLLKDEADKLIFRCCAENANKPVLLSELSDLLYKISGCVEG